MNQDRSNYGQNMEPVNGSQTGWNTNGMPPYQATGYQNMGQQGYPNMPQQSQYVPPTMDFRQNGFSAHQNNYATPAANGYNAVAGVQNGYTGANPAQNPYGQAGAQGGYSQAGNTGYTGNMPGAGTQGSFIPQTPYTPYNQQQVQPGYGQPGMQGGYAQGGYTGYPPVGANGGQMPVNTGYQAGGYNTGYNGQNQVPLNGGGYVPQQPPIRKQAFVFDDMKLFLLGAILVALFVVGVFAGIAAVKWAFAALALISVVLFWVKPLIDENKRLCFTVVFAVLMVIALIPMGGKTQPTRPAGSNTATTTAGIGNGNGSGTQNQINGNLPAVNVTENVPAVTPSPVPHEDTATTDQLALFMQYWAGGKYDEMLSLCAPSWQANSEKPKVDLFGIIASRVPQSYVIEKVSGTIDDSSRTVTLVADIDRNNMKGASKFRFNVLMVKEGGNWYLDPSSLRTFDSTETATPVAYTPTPEPVNVNSNTILYYNPNGGAKYHLDQNCISTNARYLPLKGSFKYSQVNDSAYAALSPCNVCNAPLR